MATTALPPVLVAGEVLVDVLPAGGAPGGGIALEGRLGGSPANVAVGLARLEVPVVFAGRLATRGYGPWLRRRLEAEGVDLAASLDAGEPCTLAVVTLDGAGVASYEFYGPGSADWAWQPGELPAPASLAGRSVHTGSLATAVAPGAAVVARWLAELRASGDVAVSYDPNIRASRSGRGDLAARVVGPCLAAAHLVKASEEDLEVLHPGVPVEEVARRWLRDDGAAGGGGGGGGGPSLVVVTRGGAGATAWHRDGRERSQPAAATDVVDTVGAGDAFSAGLLASLWSAGALTPGGLASIGDDTLSAALAQASLVAGVTCSRPGADPPRRHELAQADGSTLVPGSSTGAEHGQDHRVHGGA